MVIEKIAVKTLRQEVYDQLRDKIISADILPGETISLRELAQKFGVSLMPVREALWQLESERIIVIESNKRIRVNTLTAKEMEEALRLRLMLESTAAERACDLRPESALPKVRKQLEALQGRCRSAKDIHAQEQPVSYFHLFLGGFSIVAGNDRTVDGAGGSVCLYLCHCGSGQHESFMASRPRCIRVWWREIKKS